MTEFQEAILRVTKLVPKGKVISYGQIAAYLGLPRGARQIGWAMRTMEGVPGLSWWRVLNNAGKITIKGNHFNDAELQQKLLRADGLVVENLELDIAKYRFRPTAEQLAGLKLDPEYIRRLLAKYDIG